MPGKEPVEKSGSRAADVKITRGAWRKTDSDFFHKRLPSLNKGAIN
jgi:hypothetical protein